MKRGQEVVAIHTYGPIWPLPQLLGLICVGTVLEAAFTLSNGQVDKAGGSGRRFPLVLVAYSHVR